MGGRKIIGALLSVLLLGFFVVACSSFWSVPRTWSAGTGDVIQITLDARDGWNISRDDRFQITDGNGEIVTEGGFDFRTSKDALKRDTYIGSGIDVLETGTRGGNDYVLYKADNQWYRYVNIAGSGTTLFLKCNISEDTANMAFRRMKISVLDPDSVPETENGDETESDSGLTEFLKLNFLDFNAVKPVPIPDSVSLPQVIADNPVLKIEIEKITRSDLGCIDMTARITNKSENMISVMDGRSILDNRVIHLSFYADVPAVESSVCQIRIPDSDLARYKLSGMNRMSGTMRYCVNHSDTTEEFEYDFRIQDGDLDGDAWDSDPDVISLYDAYDISLDVLGWTINYDGSRVLAVRVKNNTDMTLGLLPGKFVRVDDLTDNLSGSLWAEVVPGASCIEHLSFYEAGGVSLISDYSRVWTGFEIRNAENNNCIAVVPSKWFQLLDSENVK